MFSSFFLDRNWWPWSLLGSALILGATWYQVRLDLQIVEWYGDFFNLIQKALGTPGSVTLPEFFGQLTTFAKIAAVYVFIVVLLEFFIRHYIFRWRTAMNSYYVTHWPRVRTVEGASQRVQEDTMRFARLVEGLGVSFMRSLMTLVAFLPLLWVLSANVKVLPYFGAVPHSLVWVAILFSIFGTVALAVVGIRLPGLEFNNQRVEAAFRKELVYGEDHSDRAQPATLHDLFSHVRANYFTLYRNYLYFDVARISYLQVGNLLPYIALGPTLISGAITLGLMQQIVSAFERVTGSFQYLVNSWTTIVELMSVYKRLRGFELEIARAEVDLA